MGGSRALVTGLILLAIGIPAPATATTCEGVDAGGTTLTARPVGPGTYSGCLLYVADTSDYYAFEAEAGQALVVAFTGTDDPATRAPETLLVVRAPDGAPLTLTYPYGRTFRVPITESGTWYVEARLYTPVATYPLAFSSSYTLDFRLEEPRGIASSGAVSRWHAFEARPSAAGAVWGVASIPRPQHAPTPESYLLLVEGQTYDIMVSGSGAVGGTLSVPALEVRADVPVEVDARILGDTVVVSWYLARSDAPVRVSAYSMGVPVPTRFGIVTEAPVVAASASGDGVVSWDGSGERSVLAPGLSVHAAARGFRVETDARFLGLFKTDGVEGEATLPDGSLVSLGPGRQSHALTSGLPGVYEFRVAPSVDAAHEAQKHYVQGALFPRLGIY